MLHIHKWKVLTFHAVDTYHSEKDELPILHETEFSWKCEKCGKPRVTRIQGRWRPQAGTIWEDRE